MKNWHITNETCPKCGVFTETLEDDTHQFAERCPAGCFYHEFSTQGGD